VFDPTGGTVASDAFVPRKKVPFLPWQDPKNRFDFPFFHLISAAMSSAIPAPVETRLQALCAAIADAPEIRSARQQAEAFLADDAAVGLYREMMTLGNQLQQMHRAGEQLDDDEVQRFEQLREQSNNHPGIQSFHDAQDVLQGIANAVNGFVTKTLEKGSVPSAEEVFGSGGCGEGCGCH
jgi:cell fate (sporulation/competence/biofilm development) regulator YlbF (YheA/YmcA/DUF963 family)